MTIGDQPVPSFMRRLFTKFT